MSPFRITLICTLTAIFVGCSPSELKSTSKDATHINSTPYNLDFVSFQDEEIKIMPFSTNPKSDKEDLGIINALIALDEGNLEQSAILFKQLYKDIKNPDYLKQALGITLELNRFNALKQEDFDDILKDTKEYLALKPDSQDVIRTLIAILITTKETKQAEVEAKKLIKLEENEENYELLGSVLVINGDIKNAQKAFQKAYSFNQSAIALERLVSIMNIKETITLLETHIRFKGCEEKLCYILGEIYKKNKNFKRLEQIYTKQYNQDPNIESLQALLNVRLYNKNYAQAITLLEENPYYDKPLLLDLYREQKEWHKAILLSQELYTETQESKYIIIQAMLEYESLKQPIKPASLTPIIKKLEHIINQGQGNDLIFNFLGYILIDHQIDVARGIQWIQKALEERPDLPAYLDSLGWGYFYLNECKKALEVFEQIPEKERNKEPEIKEHYKKVKECILQRKKGEI